MYDLAILGGGPAGLTATVYALRKHMDVLLITRDLGGKVNYRLQLPFIEHHLVITGEEVVSRFSNEVEYLDFSRTFDMAEAVERREGSYRVHTRSAKTYDARTLIVCTGALGRLLNVPGEKEFMMRGLCYSAISYAPLFVGREVVVVGDQSLALRATAELARIAKRVTLLAPTQGDLGSALGKRVAAQRTVEILEGYTVDQVLGDGYARALAISRGGERRELRADGFFVELGLSPQSEMVANLVGRDAQQRIHIDCQNATSAPGIFAAGDVTDVYAEQVLIAVGEGAKAALAAQEYLLTY
ncbi:MAG: NAD(P)/FAD-dependent oxidoreductase [Anaerolineales bacterium]